MHNSFIQSVYGGLVDDVRVVGPERRAHHELHELIGERRDGRPECGRRVGLELRLASQQLRDVDVGEPRLGRDVREALPGLRLRRHQPWHGRPRAHAALLHDRRRLPCPRGARGNGAVGSSLRDPVPGKEGGAWRPIGWLAGRSLFFLPARVRILHGIGAHWIGEGRLYEFTGAKNRGRTKTYSCW